MTSLTTLRSREVQQDVKDLLFLLETLCQIMSSRMSSTEGINYHGEADVTPMTKKLRLDRTLANVEWFDLFPSGSCNYLRFEGSDHRPLRTYLESHKVKKRTPFRYDRRLNEIEEARRIIESAWQQGEEENVDFKISRCRKEIIKWSKVQKDITAMEVL